MQGNVWAHKFLLHYLITTFIKLDDTNFKHITMNSFSRIDGKCVGRRIDDSGNNVEAAILSKSKSSLPFIL